MLFAVGCGCALVSDGGPTAARDTAAESATETATHLSKQWKVYVGRFVAVDGRVIDDGNERISHSESQGYGMLIAAMVGDKEVFDRLWCWTREHLFVRQDDLAAWRWEPEVGKVTDYHNATDADLLIAWALIEADLRWDVTAYREWAGRILHAVRHIATSPSSVGPVLKPSAEKFDASHQPDGPVINLSYWVFPALERLKERTRDPFWGAIASSGLALIDRARFGPSRLPAEWISMAGDELRPARQFDPVFGYNAIRIPLYLAWAYPNDRKRLSAFLQAFERMGAQGPVVVDVRDGTHRERFRGVGYAAIGAVMRCLVRDEVLPIRFSEVSTDGYYPATLHVLALLAVVQTRPDCLRL